MKRQTAKTSERLIVLILIFSITGLSLLSFLPWISTTEADSVQGELYFNYDMMRKSSNTEIKNLAADINFISILFWVVVILCLISFIFITFHASLKFSRFGQIAMALVSILLLVFSILIVYLEYDLIQTVEGSGKIALSNIVFHVKYAYIQILFAILLLVFCVYYNAIATQHSIKQFRSLKNEEEVKTITPKEQPMPKPIKSVPKTNKKRVEMESWLEGQAQMLDKKTESPEPDYLKKEIAPQKEEEKQTIDAEEKNIKQPFPEEDTKIKTKETDEVRPAQSFEKALSYAIEKKIKRPEPSETQEPEPQKIETAEEDNLLLEQKEETNVKKIKLRCPQCKNVFLTELAGESTKIKCPTCGKEGVIKQKI